MKAFFEEIHVSFIFCFSLFVFKLFLCGFKSIKSEYTSLQVSS